MAGKTGVGRRVSDQGPSKICSTWQENWNSAWVVCDAVLERVSCVAGEVCIWCGASWETRWGELLWGGGDVGRPQWQNEWIKLVENLDDRGELHSSRSSLVC